MAEKVGAIYYDVSLDTRQLIEGQRQIQKQLSTTSGYLREFGEKLNDIAQAVKLYAAAQAALKIAETADEFRLLASRVEIAAGSVDGGAQAFARLVAISRSTATSLAGNIDVFNRLNQSIVQMGGNQQDTLSMTELLAKAIKVSGASAVEAKSAMLQFGQALGSGKLQGDELRSLLENAPYLMRQLADSMGVPLGALKKLGEDGKLTADVVANALSKAATKINSDFKKVPLTFESAMQVASDSAGLAALKFDELTQSSATLAGAAKGVGEVFDQLADQMAAANDAAGGLGRSQHVQTWAQTTKVALSYVADAADLVWQTLSVLGRNVAFVFTGIGAEIGGLAAQAVAVAKGDLSGAAAIGDAMKADAEKRRKDLDDADAKTLAKAKLAGQQMREAWEQGAGGGRGAINPPVVGAGGSKLKSPVDQDEANKLKARAEAAQSYYQGLVADNATAVAKIDAEEEKALSDNRRRMAADSENKAVYEKAKLEIQKKFATERAALDEKTTQEIADLNIELTTDEVQKIEAIRLEANRRADASVALGVQTVEQAERAKTSANFKAAQQRAALLEQVQQSNADTVIAATVDELAKIDLVRQESFRRADAAAKSGAITYAQAEADKARAAVEAQNSIRQQVLSINPLAQLTQEYEQKLAIVKYYETQMAQAGVDGTEFVEAKRTELSRQYQQQRLALAESEFAAQSAGNQFLVDSLNSLSSTATSSISGLIEGTMTASEAMRNLASTVLNEAVGALVQIGVQYIKNALISEAADKALLANKAANAVMYTAAITAQVTGTSALAAQAAFASTAAIPIVGPAAAPAAATAAGAAAEALGAPAIATAPIAGARQYGGSVNAGSLYRINETGESEVYTANNGKQYFLPTSGGEITPANEVGSSSGSSGGSGTTNNIDINVQVLVQSDGSTSSETKSSGTDQATAKALGERMAAQAKQTMVEELRPGGLLWKLKNGQA